MADDPRDPLAAALAELEQLRAENQRLRGLLGLDARRAADSMDVAEPTLFQNAPLGHAGKVDASSPQAAKLALFRSLFAGREDVHATRWEDPRTGAAGWSPAVRGGWARASKGPREYLRMFSGVPAALFAFLNRPRSFPEAVRAGVRLGGDVDTIAAMTGALAGALHGASSIPAAWLARLEAADRLVTLADGLLQLSDAWAPPGQCCYVTGAYDGPGAHGGDRRGRVPEPSRRLG